MLFEYLFFLDKYHIVSTAAFFFYIHLNCCVYLMYTYTCAGRQAHSNAARKHATVAPTNRQNDGGPPTETIESILIIMLVLEFFYYVCLCLWLLFHPSFPYLLSESIFPRYMFTKHSRKNTGFSI